MFDKLKALSDKGNNPIVPGGLKGLLAVAAMTWGTRTQVRIAEEATTRVGLAHAEIAALEAGAQEIVAEYDRVMVLLAEAREELTALRTDISIAKKPVQRNARIATITVTPEAPKARTRAKQAAKPAPTSGPDPVTVRAWAAANNIEVSARGRLSKSVIEQYTAAVG